MFFLHSLIFTPTKAKKKKNAFHFPFMQSFTLSDWARCPQACFSQTLPTTINLQKKKKKKNLVMIMYHVYEDETVFLENISYRTSINIQTYYAVRSVFCPDEDIDFYVFIINNDDWYLRSSPLNYGLDFFFSISCQLKSFLYL